MAWSPAEISTTLSVIDASLMGNSLTERPRSATLGELGTTKLFGPRGTSPGPISGSGLWMGRAAGGGDGPPAVGLICPALLVDAPRLLVTLAGGGVICNALAARALPTGSLDGSSSMTDDFT